MDDLLDITERSEPVTVEGPAGLGPVRGYTDGRHIYFDDSALDLIAAHLRRVLDLAGRSVQVSRWAAGWEEQRGTGEPRVLRRRTILGRPHYRLDDEWLFTVIRNG